MKQSEHSTKFRHSRTCECLLIKLAQLYKKIGEVSMLHFFLIANTFLHFEKYLATTISQSLDTYDFGIFTFSKILLSSTEKLFFTSNYYKKKDCKIAICHLYWRL